MPDLSPDLIRALLLPAILISVIGFVESISVAQTLAARKRQRIDPDQEWIGLGAANIGAALTEGVPVTGGFSRSAVNFDAGADTLAAGAFTAIGLAIAALFLTPLIFFCQRRLWPPRSLSPCCPWWISQCSSTVGSIPNGISGL
jgi:SulP family sulfate permease